MRHVIRHDLGLEGARKLALVAWESYSKRFAHYDPSLSWEDDRRAALSFRAKGLKLSVRALLGTDTVELEMDVPLLLRPFSGRAAAAIEKEVLVWLEKFKAGAVLAAPES